MYNRTFWRDHIVSQGAIIQQGTPINQEHLNNIERGLLEAQVQQDVNSIMQRLHADELRNARPYKIPNKSLSSGTNTISFPSGDQRNSTDYVVCPVLQASGSASIAITAQQKNGFTVVASGTCTAYFIIIGGVL